MARFALLLAVVGCTTRDRLVALDEPAPNLVVSQARQSFGGVQVGTSVTATIHVSNSGTSPSPPLSPALTGDTAFTVSGACAAALAPGASCELRVTFAPAAFGSAAATVAIGGSLALPGAPVAQCLRRRSPEFL